MKALSGTLVALLLWTSACSSGTDAPDAGDDASASPSEDASSTESVEPSPSPSETTTAAAVVVSLATTCELYFGDMKKGDVGMAVVDAVNQTNLGTEDLAKFEDLADSLRGISERSQPELQPYLDAQAAVMEAYAEDIRTGVGSSHDLQDFRAAGLELLERCRSHILTR